MHELLKRPPDHAGRADDVNREMSEAELLALEAVYCSHGDTVHYTDPPKIFDHCDGSFIYDLAGRSFLDLGIQRQIAAQEFNRSRIVAPTAQQNLSRFHENFRTIHLRRHRVIDGIFHVVPALLVTVK